MNQIVVIHRAFFKSIILVNFKLKNKYLQKLKVVSIMHLPLYALSSVEGRGRGTAELQMPAGYLDSNRPTTQPMLTTSVYRKLSALYYNLILYE